MNKILVTAAGFAAVLVSACTVDTAEQAPSVTPATQQIAPAISSNRVQTGPNGSRAEIREQLEDELVAFFGPIRIADFLASQCGPVIFRERTYDRKIRDFAEDLRVRGYGNSDIRYVLDPKNVPEEELELNDIAYFESRGFTNENATVARFCEVAEQEIADNTVYGQWLTK